MKHQFLPERCSLPTKPHSVAIHVTLIRMFPILRYVRYLIDNIIFFSPILKQMATVDALPFYLRKIHFLFQTFAMFWTFYAFFWVIPRCLNFYIPTFREKLCLFHLHRRVGVKMEQSVPKRSHSKFRRWGITQKKARKTHFNIILLCKPGSLKLFLPSRFLGKKFL